MLEAPSPNQVELEFTDYNGKISARLRLYPPKNKLGALLERNKNEARESGEEPVQIMEGLRYEYEFIGDNAASLRLEEEYGNGTVENSTNPNRNHCGNIVAGLNVGRLGLHARNLTEGIVGRAAIEVCSQKLNYRDDYRLMLEDITKHCVGLLMELRTPTAMRVSPDPGRTPETIHQRFEFLRALIGSRNFRDALHRVSTHPHLRWEPEETSCDTRRSLRPDSRTLRQLARSIRRTPLPDEHPLVKKVKSLPERIFVYRNAQTEDTPENRFVKFALQSFFRFLNRMRHKLKEIGSSADNRLQAEIAVLETRLEAVLESDTLRSVSDPDILPLGSPVLQRKEGYREIYQAWLKFDMAARLVWKGGEDVYGVGQRDIATLYEYWVFFELMEIISSVFGIEKTPVHELIEETEDGFGLKLKSGKHLSLEGKTSGMPRLLRFRFSYNRNFSHNPDLIRSGSWTERMRPDYSLSLWPSEFTEDQAESQEIMTHVHFDAKYRVDNLDQLFGRKDEDLDDAEIKRDLMEEKQGERFGRYKRADLLKMHAYRDAIRRTQGAYVLYPGDAEHKWKGFHEILPGLGAFPLKPGNKHGRLALEKFLRNILDHVCDYATSRERLTYHIYQTHKTPAKNKILNKVPDVDISTHSRLPPLAETHVLIGWYKDEAHLKWVLDKKLYNFRMNTSVGSLRLKPEVSGARYLLLHSYNGKTSPALFRVSDIGPRVFSRTKLTERGYPGSPSQPFYLVYDVEPDPAFKDYSWDYKKLPKNIQNRYSAVPQTVTLDELMMAATQKISGIGYI